MTLTDVQPRTQELFKQMGTGNLYREAYSRGMGLSMYLEQLDPSNGYNDGLDAFSRMMKVAGIKTRSNPDLGYYADRLEAFDRDENTRALVHEWATRAWKRAQTGRDVNTRAIYGSDDQPVGSVLHQIVYDNMPRYKQIAPAIPLSELVAVATPVDGTIYEAFYLTDDTANERRVRVAAGAEIPRAKLTGGDHTIKLRKFGRVLEATYELLRHSPIDLVQLHIQRMAVQAEIDKVAAAMDVLINGDGNSGTSATNYNLTTLDPTATAGTLTLKGWLAFKLTFVNPYALTAAIVQSPVGLQLMTLNSGSANIPLVNYQGNAATFGTFQPINLTLADTTRLGISTDAPSLKILAIDARFGLQFLQEIGGSITEIDKFITRQTNAIVMTEVDGFAVYDANAVHVLNVNA